MPIALPPPLMSNNSELVTRAYVGCLEERVAEQAWPD
jgi:hypothetical protein